MLKSKSYVWQPLVVIVPERIECDCGTKAIFIELGEHETTNDEHVYGYVAWCQDCWERDQG